MFNQVSSTLAKLLATIHQEAPLWVVAGDSELRVFIRLHNLYLVNTTYKFWVW
jgi:hypothetical protein